MLFLYFYYIYIISQLLWFVNRFSTILTNYLQLKHQIKYAGF
nr:MAG TPA: hypothetical protein [Caudoviricetes sp.]